MLQLRMQNWPGKNRKMASLSNHKRGSFKHSLDILGIFISIWVWFEGFGCGRGSSGGGLSIVGWGMLDWLRNVGLAAVAGAGRGGGLGTRLSFYGI